MRLQVLAGALALAGSSTALSDSSPWVLLSTSPFPDTIDSAQIQTSSQVLKHTKDVLGGCPTDKYLFVSQPGVKAGDLLGPNNSCSMPHLCQAVEDSRVHGKYTVSEVVGDVGIAGLRSHLNAACGQKGKSVLVDELALASPAPDDMPGTLAQNDATLAQSLAEMTEGDSYTVIFMSTPGEPAYESDFDEPVRMDLKRHLQGSPIRRNDDGTERDTRPLFEKYQFFTPGIFMGIIIALVLLTILGAGVKALASLEVSYGAFEKDMGPAAHKKQQ